jgi:hypothetical protein
MGPSYRTVIFKSGVREIFSAVGEVGDLIEGEPYDTLTIFSTAALDFKDAVEDGRLQRDAWKQVSSILIEDVRGGTLREYTDADIAAMSKGHRVTPPAYR